MRRSHKQKSKDEATILYKSFFVENPTTEILVLIKFIGHASVQKSNINLLHSYRVYGHIFAVPRIRFYIFLACDIHYFTSYCMRYSVRTSAGTNKPSTLPLTHNKGSCRMNMIYSIYEALSDFNRICIVQLVGQMSLQHVCNDTSCVDRTHKKHIQESN